MANRHIKIINGRRYYYESIRKGKKVLSKYLGPVDERKRKPKMQPAEQQPATQVEQQSEQAPEETYIG
ncbi:MAG: hypothetical protein HYW26_02100 [Candidatus Aenigmarchaeota archaeon]|nr:hypothetical protein [Candidatus Aenigmarchaeota archaeon]